MRNTMESTNDPSCKNFITFMLCISHVELNSGEFAHVILRFLFLLNIYYFLFLQSRTLTLQEIFY